MIEEILQHASPKSVAITAVALLVLWQVVEWVVESYKIKSLGARPPLIRGWLPYNIDLIYKFVEASKVHKNLESWEALFNGISTATSKRYTGEASPAGRRIIFTADPENIKAILATQFNDYGKGKPFNKDWKDFLGDSIFTTDLDEWHNSRQLIRPQFIKDRVSDLAVFERHVQTLMQEIGRASVGGRTEVEISNWFFRYTLDAATDFLLGKSVDSLQMPETAFAEAFAEVQRVQNTIARAGPLNYLVPRKSFYAGIKVINEFVNPYIDEALNLSPAELATKTKSEEGYTFLHALAGFTRDRTVLRDQLVAVLLAGRDTTASILSWTFYELSRHPEVVRRVREEIIGSVGLERAPTYDDLKGMRYLQNVINETLRLYPAVPFNVRLALKDTTLPTGGGPDGLSPIGILKDTPIGYSTLLMQRRPDLYPPTSSSFPDPLIFAPSRWETWQPRPWQFIPFNGGPRICIGQQFALTEMGYTIVRLLQKYEGVENRMDVVDGGKPVLKAEIVLQPGQGVRVGLVERTKV